MMAGQTSWEAVNEKRDEDEKQSDAWWQQCEKTLADEYA